MTEFPGTQKTIHPGHDHTTEQRQSRQAGRRQKQERRTCTQSQMANRQARMVKRMKKRTRLASSNRKIADAMLFRTSRGSGSTSTAVTMSSTQSRTNTLSHTTDMVVARGSGGHRCRGEGGAHHHSGGALNVGRSGREVDVGRDSRRGTRPSDGHSGGVRGPPINPPVRDVCKPVVLLSLEEGASSVQTGRLPFFVNKS